MIEKISDYRTCNFLLFEVHQPFLLNSKISNEIDSDHNSGLC